MLSHVSGDTTPALVVCAALCALPLLNAATEEAIPMPAGQKQLFLDDHCIAEMTGRPVRLKIHLCNAKLYAFWTE